MPNGIRTWVRAVVVLVSLAWVFHGVYGSAAVAPPSGPSPSPETTAATLFVVGDVMYKETSHGAELVGQLLEKSLAESPRDSRAFVLGDFCNDDGSEECYRRLDRTAWGRLRPLLHTVPGNHDYEDARRIPDSIPFYFNYVLQGGQRSKGWQAFDWGGWRIVGLNSELMETDADSNGKTMSDPLGREQMVWLDKELQSHSRDQCVLTAYHRPMYSSGRFASPSWVGPIFRKSYRYGVDLYVTGHEHFFAHMPPMAPILGPDNLPLLDRVYGVEGLIAGTGGAVLFPHPTVDPRIKRGERGLKYAKYDEEVLANHWGIVRLDLAPGQYKWRFIPVDPKPGVVYPSGSGVCHSNPSGYKEPVPS